MNIKWKYGKNTDNSANFVYHQEWWVLIPCYFDFQNSEVFSIWAFKIVQNVCCLCMQKFKKLCISCILSLGRKLLSYFKWYCSVSYQKWFCKIRSLFPKHSQSVHLWLTFIAVHGAWHACIHASMHPFTIHPSIYLPPWIYPSILLVTYCPGHHALPYVLNNIMCIS